MPKLNSRILNLTVVVAAMGYFVDIYDLTLFMIVRHNSLLAIGVAPANLLSQVLFIPQYALARFLAGFGFVLHFLFLLSINLQKPTVKTLTILNNLGNIL